MELPHILTTIAIFGYLITTLLVFRETMQSSRAVKLSTPPKVVWLAALLIHSIALGLVLFTSTGLNLSLHNALSIVAWFISLLLYFSAWRHPLGSLALVILPCVSLALIGGLMSSGSMIIAGSLGLQWHVLGSLLGFSVLTLGSAQALLLAYQDRRLRYHKLSGWVRHLPPLQHMEEFLFQLIGIGFLLLTFSLISGWLFVEDIFAQHLVHKTVLSMIAWVIFAVLLLGRRIQGWRGQKAIHWTLWGYVLLVLAYFGSKLVLEIILHRS